MSRTYLGRSEEGPEGSSLSFRKAFLRETQSKVLPFSYAKI